MTEDYPKDWAKGTLGDFVSDIQGGGTPARKEPAYWHGSIPWVTVKDLRDDQGRIDGAQESITQEGLTNSSASLIPEGTPILCTRMAVGRTVLPTRSVAINQDLKALHPGPHLDPRYLHRVLQLRRRDLEAVAVGSTVKGVRLGDVRSLEIGMPVIPEQRRIADVLDTVDATIRETDDVIAKQEQVKTGLLQDLLTRGLDAEGRLRDPEAEPNWEWKRLESLSQSITSGSRGWAKYYSETGSLFLRIGNLSRRKLGLDLSDKKFVDLPDEKLSARSKVKPGDVLISITADLGIVGLVPGDIGQAFINQHIALVRPVDESYLSDWVAYFLAGELGQEQFYRLNDAGAKAGLNLTSIGKLEIPVPQPSERERIVDMVRHHERKIESESSYRSKLKCLKTGLMRDLLTGRVRVPKAKERVEEITR